VRQASREYHFTDGLIRIGVRESGKPVTFVRSLARRLIPGRVKRWIRRELAVTPRSPTPRELEIKAVVSHLRGKVPIHTLPGFAGDDLVSWHNPEFLEDPAFIRAVEAGNARHSWDLSRDVRWRYHVILWAARRAVRLEGDFVECGVNRGGFSRAVVDYVDFARLDKTFFLMDTFNGLVEEYISPAERAKGVSRETYSKYGDSYDDVKEAFRPFPNVVLIRGPIPDTLPQVAPEKVCYLSIDMNVVIPEIAAATHFWDRLVSGAVMILDDYGHLPYVEQKHAFDAFADERGVQVLQLPTGQGLIFKP
jgi:O-methyltransferase